MSKKRVLWLTNTPALLTEELMGRPVASESWLAALQDLVVEHAPGIELHVAFFHEGRGIRRVEHGGVTYWLLPRGGKWRRLWRRYFLIIHGKDDLENIRKVIGEVDPALVHVFGTESAFGLVATRCGRPAIVQIQGVVNSLLPVYFGGESVWCAVNKAGFFDLLMGGVYFRYLLEKKKAERELEILQNTEYVLGNTDLDREFSGEVNPSRRFFFLPDPMRRPFLDPEPMEKKGNARPVIHTIMHEEYYKGLDLLFRVAALLNEKGVDFEWRIAGLNGNEKMVRIFSKLTLGYPKGKVRFMGRLGGDALAKSLSEADIYVHTSYIENPSNAVCEAQCLGVPVIAAQVGGTPSIIEEGVTGLMYERGNTNELTELIIKLLQDKELASGLALRGRETALIRHDSDAILKELLRIYGEVSGVSFE